MGFTSAARSSCEEAVALRFDCGMARLFADGGLSLPRRAATRYGYRRYRSPHHPLMPEGGSCAARLARPSGAGGVYLRESAFLRIGWAGPVSRRGLAPCRASIEKAAMSPSGRLLQRARVLARWRAGIRQRDADDPVENALAPYACLRHAGRVRRARKHGSSQIKRLVAKPCWNDSWYFQFAARTCSTYVAPWIHVAVGGPITRSTGDKS